MLDGFRLRGLMHPVTDQFDAPFFYDDERATFFITPDERVEKVAIFTGFYVPVEPPAKVEVPPLYEKPKAPDPIGPVSNPFEASINARYDNTIASNAVFHFDGVNFDARGPVTAGKTILQ
jgi:hypothetical protein